MLGDFELFKSPAKATEAVKDARETFGENVPYSIAYNLDGKVYSFNDHLLAVIVEALTTECMAKMSSPERDMFDRLMEYEDSSSIRDITNEGFAESVEALDKVMADLVSCRDIKSTISCIDDKFEFKNCGVK